MCLSGFTSVLMQYAGLVIVVHAGNQADAFRYITKIYFFDTAAVRVRGVYAYKPDKFLQRNLLAGALGVNHAILHMLKAEYITAAVYQVIIALVVVQV